MCNYTYSDDFYTCYLFIQLGLVREVKLTTYLITPYYTYPEKEFSDRKISKISESQFQAFRQKIARRAILKIETSDYFFLWLHKKGLDHEEMLAFKYHLPRPRRNIVFRIRF